MGGHLLRAHGPQAVDHLGPGPGSQEGTYQGGGNGEWFRRVDDTKAIPVGIIIEGKE